MTVDRIFRYFEAFISMILVLLMGIVVVSSILELGHVLYRDLVAPPGFFLGLDGLYDTFGLFMLVVIALELMGSIYAYCNNKAGYIEIMFLIAMTAITRKIVILDSKSTDPMTLLGIAAVLVALVAGLYVLKQQRRSGRDAPDA